jgi:hypothetical protein
MTGASTSKISSNNAQRVTVRRPMDQILTAEAEDHEITDSAALETFPDAHRVPLIVAPSVSRKRRDRAFDLGFRRGLACIQLGAPGLTLQTPMQEIDEERKKGYKRSRTSSSLPTSTTSPDDMPHDDAPTSMQDIAMPQREPETVNAPTSEIDIAVNRAQTEDAVPATDILMEPLQLHSLPNTFDADIEMKRMNLQEQALDINTALPVLHQHFSIPTPSSSTYVEEDEQDWANIEQFVKAIHRQRSQQKDVAPDYSTWADNQLMSMRREIQMLCQLHWQRLGRELLSIENWEFSSPRVMECRHRGHGQCVSLYWLQQFPQSSQQRPSP